MSGPDHPTITYIGDSLTFGYGGECPFTDYIRLAPLQGRDFVVTNHGQNGRTLAHMAAAGAQEFGAFLAPQSSVNLALIWGGINDLNSGVGHDDVCAVAAGFAQSCRAMGFQVIVGTLIFAHHLEAQRLAFNDFVRANWRGFADGLADFGADPLIGTPDVQRQATYFLPDGVHLNAAGYRIVAAIAAEAITRQLAALTIGASLIRPAQATTP